MTRDQKREMYSFLLLAIVGAIVLVYTLFLWWGMDLFAGGLA